MSSLAGRRAGQKKRPLVRAGVKPHGARLNMEFLAGREMTVVRHSEMARRNFPTRLDPSGDEHEESRLSSQTTVSVGFAFIISPVLLELGQSRWCHGRVCGRGREGGCDPHGNDRQGERGISGEGRDAHHGPVACAGSGDWPECDPDPTLRGGLVHDASRTDRRGESACGGQYRDTSRVHDGFRHTHP